MSPAANRAAVSLLCRKCGLGLATLTNCRGANAGNAAACSSLDTQLVFCHAEALCPEVATAYAKCFRRVVNSGGAQKFGECDPHVAAMRKCLQKHDLYPFK